MSGSPCWLVVLERSRTEPKKHPPDGLMALVRRAVSRATRFRVANGRCIELLVCLALVGRALACPGATLESGRGPKTSPGALLLRAAIRRVFCGAEADALRPERDVEGAV
jgi:hypothetical protein